MNTGWFGPVDDVINLLEELGADRDSTGGYVVDGMNIVGLGGEEIIIDEEATYQLGGQEHKLVPLLGEKVSRGLIVKVF